MRTARWVKEQTFAHLGLTPQSENKETANRFEAGEQIVTAARLLGRLNQEDSQDMLLDALLHNDMKAAQDILNNSRRRIYNPRLIALDSAARTMISNPMSKTVFTERAAWILAHALLSDDGNVPNNFDTTTALGNLALCASQMEFTEGQPNGSEYAIQFGEYLNKLFLLQLQLSSQNSPYLDSRDPLCLVKFRRSMAASGFLPNSEVLADMTDPNSTLLTLVAAVALPDDQLTHIFNKSDLGGLTVSEYAETLLHASANNLTPSADNKYNFYCRITVPYLIQEFLKMGNIDTQIATITDNVIQLSDLLQTRENIIDEITGVLISFFADRSAAIRTAAAYAKQLPPNIVDTNTLRLALLSNMMDRAITSQ